MKVYLSPLAEYKLTLLIGYLEEKWGLPSRDKFLERLEQKFNQISAHPESNPLVEEFEFVYWCVVTPQCSIYYRLKKQEIEVITIIDNRQDPEAIRKEIITYFKA